MTTVPPEQPAIARELKRLCRSVDQFGRDLGDIKTACAVLVERSDRNEQDVRQLREDTDKDLTAIRKENRQLRHEVDALKARRWPMQAVAVLTGVVGAGTGLVALLLQ